MNTLSRQEKVVRFQTLTKVNGIATGREFEESRSTVARLLIDHPHAYLAVYGVSVGAACGHSSIITAKGVYSDNFSTTHLTSSWGTP